MGSTTTEAGAESGALEYDAVALLSLGTMNPIDPADPRGDQVVDVSITKTRFGASDLVIPFRYAGARGVFREHGEAVPGAQRRDEIREAKRERSARNKTVTIADRRILALEIAATTGTVSIAGYVQRARGAAHKLGASVAGTDLASLRAAGLLAAHALGNEITEAGRAIMDRPAPERRAALVDALGGRK